MRLPLPAWQVHTQLEALLARARTAAPGALDEVADTKRLTAAAEAELLQVMGEACSAVSTPGLS